MCRDPYNIRLAGTQTHQAVGCSNQASAPCLHQGVYLEATPTRMSLIVVDTCSPSMSLRFLFF